MSTVVSNIFFCHGGIHGIFMYLGAIEELNRNRDRLSLTNLRVFGSSIGAPMGLICIMVLYDLITIKEIHHFLEQFYLEERPFTLHLTPICMEMLEQLSRRISDPNRLLRLANQHLIILASQPSGLVRIEQYDTMQELFHCMMLSSTLVLLSSYPATYKGVCTIDAGYLIEESDLPDECLKIYNPNSCFPDSIYHPSKSKRNMLQNTGVRFIRKRFSEKQVFEDPDSDSCWLRFPTFFTSTAFFIQTYLVNNDHRWLDRIDAYAYGGSGSGSGSGLGLVADRKGSLGWRGWQVGTSAAKTKQELGGSYLGLFLFVLFILSFTLLWLFSKLLWVVVKQLFLLTILAHERMASHEWPPEARIG